MALAKIPHNPGINKDDPELTSEGAWADGNNVRFWRGRPEKIGGFQKLYAQPVEGKARGIFAWAANNGNPLMAIGTHTSLYALTGDQMLTITPIRDAGTLTNPFATTAGSSTVTVTDTAHGLDIGSAVIFAGASAVGGITIAGRYKVAAVPDGDTYRISHTTAATSTATGGGTAAYQYELSAGLEYGAVSSGWGVGGWGVGSWGTPRENTVIQVPRTWSLANWGQNLIAVPQGGDLYEWQAGSTDRAVRVAVENGYDMDAPRRITAMFVTPERFIVCLGCTEFATDVFDPLLVRWNDQELIDQWTPSALTLSGQQKLQVGSRIVGGCVSRLQNLVWTDQALYAMRYLGDTEFVFGFDLLGAGGLCGPHAFAERDGIALWMTPAGEFYIYDGTSPRQLPCTVSRYVFDALVRTQQEAVWCGSNTQYNEVWWFYPDDAGSPELNKYVCYSLADNAWSIGTMARTCWVDKTNVNKPVAVSPQGWVYVQETGIDADGEALPAHIRGAPFDAGDGDQIVSVHRIVPDMQAEGVIDVTLETRRWPNDRIEVSKTRPFTADTRKLDVRAQGRQVALTFAVDGVGDWFRLGDVRLDITQAGRR